MFFEIPALLFFAFLILLLLIWTFRNGIGPVPTGWKAQRALSTALPDKVEGDIFELGCGWGSVAVILAHRYPNNRVFAFETSPLPWIVSKVRAVQYPNLTVIYGDFMKCSLSDAGLIYCYLYREGMKRLEKKWLDEAKEETVLIAYTFALPSIQADHTLLVTDLYRSTLYFYHASKQILPIRTIKAAADTHI